MGSDVPVLFGRREARARRARRQWGRRLLRGAKTRSHANRFFARPYRERATEAVGGVDEEGGCDGLPAHDEDSLEVGAETWSGMDGQVLTHRCGVDQAGSLSFTDISELGSRGRAAYWPVYGSCWCASNTLSACRRCRMIASATLGDLGKLPACCRPSSLTASPSALFLQRPAG